MRPHTGVSVFPQQLYNLLVDVFGFYTDPRPILAKQHFSPPFNCDVSLQWQEFVRIGSKSIQFIQKCYIVNVDLFSYCTVFTKVCYIVYVDLVS